MHAYLALHFISLHCIRTPSPPLYFDDHAMVASVVEATRFTDEASKMGACSTRKDPSRFLYISNII